MSFHSSVLQNSYDISIILFLYCSTNDFKMIGLDDYKIHICIFCCWTFINLRTNFTGTIIACSFVLSLALLKTALGSSESYDQKRCHIKRNLWNHSPHEAGDTISSSSYNERLLPLLHCLLIINHLSHACKNPTVQVLSILYNLNLACSAITRLMRTR